MEDKTCKWIINDKTYHPNERYLYITKNDKWLLVREKAAKEISQNTYNKMLSRGMLDIFKPEGEY